MMTATGTALHHPRYPRSNTYDPQWVLDNQMGPHPLWLMESLTDVLPVEEGMRVLDLGCGKALTSVFLAREFGAEVWAADLWIEATANQERIRSAGVDDQVFALHAEAHDLPFAGGFFDAIVSVDAYHYFGSDDLYIGYLTRFLAEGGLIGVVSPGIAEEFGSAVPSEIAPYWNWEFCSFHSPEWWRKHWEKTGKASVLTADLVPEGWKDWLNFNEVKLPLREEHLRQAAEEELTMLRADAGKTFGFTRIVARKR